MSNLPPAEYYASLPKMITGAAAILHDPDGRILLVKPAYRHDTWELPGGALDHGEDPIAAARRETREELGLIIAPRRLLVIDWMPAQPDGRPPLANFLFDGGPLTEGDARTRIHLTGDEIAAWHMASPREWDTLLSAHMARRVHACARALAENTSFYLHAGTDPTSPTA